MEVSKVLKELEFFSSRGIYSREVFSTWLEMMTTSLAGEEKEFKELIERFKSNYQGVSKEISRFSKAFALLLEEYKENQKDVIGELYMKWNISNKITGQFFTPWTIATFMANVLQPFGIIFDPTCGSGTMLVAAAKFADNDNSLFVGQDIDVNCFRMCALNLCFFNLNGFAILGDSLSGEINQVYQSTRSYLGGSIRKLDENDLEQFKKTIYPKIKKGQQTLL